MYGLLQHSYRIAHTPYNGTNSSRRDVGVINILTLYGRTVVAVSHVTARLAALLHITSRYTNHISPKLYVPVLLIMGGY